MIKSPSTIWKRFPLIIMGVLLISFFNISVYGQVGINTTNPQGTLDVTTINNTGLVLPRVTAIEDVTDGNGNPPVNGTTVYDISRNTTCFYQNGSWICIGVDANGDPILTNETPIATTFNPSSSTDYIKASNTDDSDLFGYDVALSEDGNTLAVSAVYESSNATGVNGNQNSNTLSLSGAVYVFIKNGSTWSQQAYVKASNPDALDTFGYSIDLSDDGNTLAVSALNEDSSATGINGNQADNSSTESGALYVFTRSGVTWTQQGYIKASNTNIDDRFGTNIALSGDGNTLAVGARLEDSNATGINGNQTDNSSSDSGAVYVFVRTGSIWTQQAYIKASNSDSGDYFGYGIALSGNGNTLVVSAPHEDSNATGVNGNQASNTSGDSGAVYIFERSGTIWTQQAYIKASNTGFADTFGGGDPFGNDSVALSSNGNTLVVGAGEEDSNAIGINGNQFNNLADNSGAAYVFIRTGTIWTQQAYIKASNTEVYEFFGASLTLSNDGNKLAIAASVEDSNATGINGDQNDNSILYSGAVYIFIRTGSTWTQEAYVKATNTSLDPWFPNGNYFGACLALSGDGNTLAVGSPNEDSFATGVNGDQTNTFSHESGAIYVYYAN